MKIILLVIVALMISCGSKDLTKNSAEKLQNKSLQQGTETSGGGSLLYKDVIDYVFDEFIEELSMQSTADRFYYEQVVFELNNRDFFKEYPKLSDVLFFDNFNVMTDEELILKEQFNKKKYLIFYSSKNYLKDRVILKSQCFDLNGKIVIASVDSFLPTGNICFSKSKFQKIPFHSLKSSMFSIFFHEVCHLAGHKSEKDCMKVQEVAEKIYTVNKEAFQRIDHMHTLEKLLIYNLSQINNQIDIYGSSISIGFFKNTVELLQNIIQELGLEESEFNTDFQFFNLYLNSKNLTPAMLNYVRKVNERLLDYFYHTYRTDYLKSTLI